ncbi:MAG: hypothetical protein RSF93_07675 [Mucinivorans sp.]
MKKIILASIVLLSAFFTSCTKSELTVAPDGANTLRAVMENSDGDGSSRTTLDGYREVVWSAGDKLDVFTRINHKLRAEYTLIQGEGTSLGVFKSNKSLGTCTKYAFYPASAGVTCVNDVMSFNLPATQVYTTASFANGSNPMVAGSDDQDKLWFRNLCGIIKFQLTGTKTVASVKMQTDAGEVVAGAMTVDMNYYQVPEMKVATTGTTSTSITLTDCNVQLSEWVSSSFYFTVPAATYAAGLTFTAYDGAGNVIRTKTTSVPLEVSRSRIASLQEVGRYFPDANFRKKLVDTYGFIQTGNGSDTDINITDPANADKLKTTKELNISSAQITNIKGIKYFTELTELNCSGNSLRTLDVSANTKLIKLDCSGSELRSLAFKANATMKTLWCQNNNLGMLDVRVNTALADLNCSGSKLSRLYLGNIKTIKKLQCQNNKLTTLDLTKNTAMTELMCYNNRMSALDITKFTNFTNPALLQCGEQKGSDGTGTQTLTLTLTQPQKTLGLGAVGTLNNGHVTLNPVP